MGSRVEHHKNQLASTRDSFCDWWVQGKCRVGAGWVQSECRGIKGECRGGTGWVLGGRDENNFLKALGDTFCKGYHFTLTTLHVCEPTENLLSNHWVLV
jgi:hypothetical protein